jgi:hypothetical protein
MCDLRVTHFLCARNSLFNTMYTTTTMPSITPSNFCNFSIFFSDQKNIFQKSHYFWRGTHIRPSPMRRVRVVVIKRGPKQICTHLFYGRSDNLQWDPDWFEWCLSTPLMGPIGDQEAGNVNGDNGPPRVTNNNRFPRTPDGGRSQSVAL